MSSTMEPDEGARPDDQPVDAPRWEGTEDTEEPAPPDDPDPEGTGQTDAPRWEGVDTGAEASDPDATDSADR
jgi:hypothetical protein